MRPPAPLQPSAMPVGRLETAKIAWLVAGISLPNGISQRVTIPLHLGEQGHVVHDFAGLERLVVESELRPFAGDPIDQRGV